MNLRKLIHTCLTFVSMSIVNLGVSGIVNRKYNANDAGRHPSPSMILHVRSISCIKTVDGVFVVEECWNPSNTKAPTTLAPV